MTSRPFWLLVAFAPAACNDFRSQVRSATHDVEVVSERIIQVDGLALDADGSIVAVEEIDGGRALRIDPASGAQRLIANGFDRADNVVVDGDGMIYLTLEIDEGKVMRVTPEGAVSEQVAGLDHPEGLELGPAGELYIVEHADPGRLLRVDRDGSLSELGRFHDGEGLARLPDGSLVVAETSEDRLTRLFPDGRRALFASGLVHQPDGVTYDTEGHRLLVTEDARPGRLLAVDADNGGLRSVIAEGLNAPQTTVVEADGSILIAEQQEARILRLRPR